MLQHQRAIPLSSPHLDNDDLALVRDALLSGWLASGPLAEQFEREFASRLGADFAVATASGTAALHMAVLAAGVKDGDFVITSPFSFVASANVILYERGIPVFVDIDPDTLCIDPGKAVEAVETLVHRRHGWRALLPRTQDAGGGHVRAVLPVHIFGGAADVGPIASACRSAEIRVIEDACEALGASSDGIPVGRAGDAAAFGFYPNKQVTAGEGGMLVTDNKEWADLFRALRNQGRSNDDRWVCHDRLGFNYRMDELSAALALSQLRRLDDLLARRQSIADRYTRRLAGLNGVSPLPPPRPGSRRSWFLYTVRFAPEIDRDRLMVRLNARGIMSRPYFRPIHLQPFYIERFGFTPGDFPRAEAAGRSLLSLPMPLASGLDDVDYVCEVLQEELARL